MKLGWGSAALRAACYAQQAMATRWPGSESTARTLLSAVAHADDLAELGRLRCLDVRLGGRPGAAEVHISLEEVQMHAAVLPAGTAIAGGSPVGHAMSRYGGATELVVLDLTAHGLALVRAAS